LGTRHSLRPLIFRRREIQGRTSRETCGEIEKLRSPSLRGALATKQSILWRGWHGLLRCARNDADRPLPVIQLCRQMMLLEIVSVAWAKAHLRRDHHPSAASSRNDEHASAFALRASEDRSSYGGRFCPPALIPSAGQCRTQPVNARQFRGTVQPADGGCCPKVQLASLA
jgi:hypothetical protein